MNRIFKPDAHIVLCGDFNIDPVRNVYESDCLKDVLSGFNLVNIIESPTRVTDTCSSILDHIYVNFTAKDSSVMVLDNNISDHKTILGGIDFNLTSTSPASSYIGRSFGEDNTRNFWNDLYSEDWQILYNISSLHEAFSYFYGVFMHHFNVRFPKCKKYVNKDKKEWVSNKVRQSSNDLKLLNSILKTNPGLKGYYSSEKKRHKMLVADTKRTVLSTKNCRFRK